MATARRYEIKRVDLDYFAGKDEASCRRLFQPGIRRLAPIIHVGPEIA